MRSGFKMSEFHDVAASFGQPIPTKGLRGRAVPANPDEGCDSIDPAPEDTEHNLPMFAVIGEGGFTKSHFVAFLAKNTSMPASQQLFYEVTGCLNAVKSTYSSSSFVNGYLVKIIGYMVLFFAGPTVDQVSIICCTKQFKMY